MGLRMKSFNIMGVHCKTRFLGVFKKKKQYTGGELSKKEDWDSWQDLRGVLEKKMLMVFWRGVHNAMHTVYYDFSILTFLNYKNHRYWETFGWNFSNWIGVNVQ